MSLITCIINGCLGDARVCQFHNCFVYHTNLSLYKGMVNVSEFQEDVEKCGKHTKLHSVRWKKWLKMNEWVWICVRIKKWEEWVGVSKIWNGWDYGWLKLWAKSDSRKSMCILTIWCPTNQTRSVISLQNKFNPNTHLAWWCLLRSQATLLPLLYVLPRLRDESGPEMSFVFVSFP